MNATFRSRVISFAPSIIDKSWYFTPMDTSPTTGAQHLRRNSMQSCPHSWTGSFQKPDEVQKDPRFGVAAFQHPDVVSALQEAAEELRFLDLVDALCFDNEKKHWAGTWRDLHNHLTGDPNLGRQAEKLLYWHASTLRYLQKLHKTHPHRVARPPGHTKSGLWVIKPPEPVE